jgi:hypothetical protein
MRNLLSLTPYRPLSLRLSNCSNHSLWCVIVEKGGSVSGVGYTVAVCAIKTSVQVGCFRFSRCFHLIIDVSFSSARWRLVTRLTQSPELGVWAFDFPFPVMFLFSAALANRPWLAVVERFRMLLRSPTDDADGLIVLVLVGIETLSSAARFHR